MRSWVALLLIACITAVAHAQKCDLEGKKDPVDFPNIEDLADESYEMTVEYTLPNARQTDFYTEYYDILFKRGRVDAQQSGKTLQFMYAAESWEAWEINSQYCNLTNVTDTPEMFRDFQSDWVHIGDGGENMRTIGPSAMLKLAFDVWNSTGKGGNKMAYMGVSKDLIRGLSTRYWRLCKDDGSLVEYFFTTERDENPSGLKVLKTSPLRIMFGGVRSGEEFETNDQVYDIMTFRPFIPKSLQPFDLPKGRGCRRDPLADPPDLPTFDGKNIMFSSEVVYRTIDRTEIDTQLNSFYSTLKMALDETSQHIAYHYTPWAKTKKGEEPDADSPESIIYDMRHHYAYKTVLETGDCQIIREKSFYPLYVLPNGGGAISLTDPSILFPNSEFRFVSEGTNRGLRVNIFEYIEEDFKLDAEDGSKINIPKAVITHSYLQDNEVERNVVSVRNALTQVQFKFYGRIPKVIEILTFNFFGFSTEIRNRRQLFNIRRCFKNDDDYVWATIGFNVDSSLLPKIRNDVPSIQKNILSSITGRSELNAVRIPVILVDFNEQLIISLMILGKPPVLLDYLEPEENMAVLNSPEIDGIEDVQICATNCLEKEDNCWGFSICGALCAYGTVLSATPGAKAGCKLYRRFDNTTYIPSKESMIDNLRRDVANQQIKLLILGDDDTPVQVEASSIEIAEPGEDDSIFNRLGNELNTRMTVVKAGYKLKGVGKQVTDMGKLRYDECQKLCLDFKDCETISYCLTQSTCTITSRNGDDIKAEEMEPDNMCNIVTRKYADHFDRTPGVILSLTAREILKEGSSEKCARACMKQNQYQCLSFDHCPADSDAPCRLHTVHYPNSKTRESVQTNSSSCGHYFRKFSTEFKKDPERRTVGSSVPALLNVTLEECSKSCIDYGEGVCYGFDFCQGRTMLATSCTLLDKFVNTYKKVENKICTNYIRDNVQYTPLPYSNSLLYGHPWRAWHVFAIKDFCGNPVAHAELRLCWWNRIPMFLGRSYSWSCCYFRYRLLQSE